MIHELSASILAANPLRLEHAISSAIQQGIRSLHLDVMDSHYVDNLALSFDQVNMIVERFPEVHHDVHLMVTNPEAALQHLPLKKLRIVSFHTSTSEQPTAVIKTIQKYCQASIAINPNEELDNFLPMLKIADHCLIMAVIPGRCGQTFQPSALNKLIELQSFSEQENNTLALAIDGGVNHKTLPDILKTSVDIAQAVVGSALFPNHQGADASQLIQYVA